MAGPVLLSPFERTLFVDVTDIRKFCDISRTPADKGLQSHGAIEIESTASQRGLGCAKGTTLALLFEAATVLGIFGIWRLWHLFR